MSELQPEAFVPCVDMTTEPAPRRRRRLDAVLEMLPVEDPVLEDLAAMAESRLIELASAKDS